MRFYEKSDENNIGTKNLESLNDYDKTISKIYSFTTVSLSRDQKMNYLGLVKKKRPRDILFGKSKPDTKIAVA